MNVNRMYKNKLQFICRNHTRTSIIMKTTFTFVHKFSSIYCRMRWMELLGVFVT